MPRALDRRTPQNDKNPLANLLDFENWASYIDEAAEGAGETIRQFQLNLSAAGEAALELLQNIADELGIAVEELSAVITAVVSNFQLLFRNIATALGIDPDEVTTVITNAVTFLEGLDLTNPGFNPAQAAIDFVNIVIAPTGLVLGKDSPINLLNAFNLLPPELAGQISHSSLGEAITNFIADPNFLDPESFTGLEQWFHDATGGHGGTGAAQTTADGTTKELLGNLIQVSQGQVMPITGKVKWSGLAGTGTPIQLAVTGYGPSGSATHQQTVASHNTTPTTTDWIDMSGTYTVPAGVASIRTRLVVGSTATAGDVWFSKMSATKSQTVFQRLIAGTDPGTTITTDVQNLFTGIMTNATTLLNKLDTALHNDLLTSLGGPDLSTIEARLDAFLHGSSPLNADNISSGNVADQFVGGVRTTLDNIVTGLLNISGSGFQHADAWDALRHQSFVDMDTSARLAQLETILTGGVSDGDDFERTSSTNIGTGWLHFKTGSGSWICDGHDAVWSASGLSACDFLEIRNTGQIRTATDLQHVGKVLGSKATHAFGRVAYNWVWLRISDDTTSLANITGIRVGFGGDGSASIVRYVAGVPTTLTSLPAGNLTAPGPGSYIWGEAGTPGSARYFRGGIGTSTLLEITEVGIASGSGAAFRRWGHGGRTDGGVITQERPGSVHQIVMKDQLT